MNWGIRNTETKINFHLNNAVPTLFLLLFFIIFILLNIFVGLFLVDFYNPLAIAALIIIEMLNILIAYRLSEFFLSLVIDSTKIPKLKELRSFPKVALLYVTFNDAMPEILHRIRRQNYPHYTVFILDDSTDPSYLDIVDNSGYCVIRRTHRHGFKAGAINNWMRQYGDFFPYFIILDSDSIIGDDFVEQIMKYAEHLDNARVAVFQSKWRIWNTENRFPRIIASLYPLLFFSFERLSNSYETPLIMGHNNLLRTSQIKNVGGFDEDFVCEDLAISLKLMENGFCVKYADIISFESCPENVSDYARRNIRWGSGTIEVARKGSRNISYISNFHLFMTSFNYLIYLFYLPGMFLVTWGYHTSFEDAKFLLSLIISGKIIFMPVMIPLMLILLYVIIFYFLRLPLAVKLKISMKDYFLGLLLIPAIDFYMLIPLISGLLKASAGKKVYFQVTQKSKSQPSLQKTFSAMGSMVAIWILLIFGVVQNPVSFIFNFFWLIPYLLSPFIIYLVEK
jgi:cellulose synthase (UDP-forming)